MITIKNISVESLQVRNHMGTLNVKEGEGQCRRLLQKLIARQQEDNQMFVRAAINDDDKMDGVLWVTGQQRQAWMEVADVLIHDNTYNLDRLGYKLGVFSGINKEGSTVPLGVCLVIDEGFDSYKWQMETWLEAMDGVAPSLVITDADPAVMPTVASAFPDALHMWCLWHMLKNIFSHCRSTVGGAVPKLITDFITVSKTIGMCAFLSR